ncbi:uncharacterized protein LOC114241577 [Bombyx mandarina]|uniref:N-acetyltransferase domain-containing protein n=2 Tax=Bombyx TaxID=7090 RepID=A0A8R2ARN0_BOMMO|nr:uncharacterized protein LOC101744677 isoform X2 [Bombyx mori]XP_028028242.1 uncharacterized protein LOC114241577 [Bombyx mandarina]
MSECVVLVRQARPEDQDARVTLVRLGLAEYNFPAFLYFFLQEVMLQFVLLCCAVLFIFFSTPLWICVLPGPALAIVTYIGCTCVHIELGHKHKRKVRDEWVGFVAELRGPLVHEPHGVMPYVVSELDADFAPVTPTRILGTVSLSALWGPADGLWLHDLTVHPQWRGRGLGGALLQASWQWALRGSGLAEGAMVEALVSRLQGSAAALLHEQGWQTRGSYRRPAGAGTALPVLRLSRILEAT